MRVIVCGGRDYGRVRNPLGRLTPEEVAAAKAQAAAEQQRVADALSGLNVTALAHGAAPGADSVAHRWAIRHRVPVSPYPAAWHIDGKAAGPIRNARMLQEFRPDAVVAFPGGRGTADMIRQARAAGVRVILVETDGSA